MPLLTWWLSVVAQLSDLYVTVHVTQPVGEGSGVVVFMAEGSISEVEGVSSKLDMLVQDLKLLGEELRFPLLLDSVAR